MLILVRVSKHQPAPYAGSLSFLTSQVGARSAQLFADRLAPLGVSPRAFGVLSNLSSTGGQSQQQLADTLGIHRNNMVGLIDELEAAGWVRRHRSQRDRRAFDVRLTRAGSALVSRINNLIPALDAEVGRFRVQRRRDREPEMRRTSFAAIFLAALALAGCSGGHPTATPTASASHTTTSTTAVSAAFRKECARFDAAYGTIQSATQGQTTVGQLMSTLTGGVGNTANDWSKQLGAAAKAADAPGVPSGGNKAHALQVKIYGVAVALDNLQLSADLGKLGKIPGAWSRVLNAIDAVRAAGCS